MTRSAPSLNEIRNEIDGLDRQIVGLIAERQSWVLQAGRLKEDESAVRAPARVEKVIAKVRALAADEGASPAVVEKAYRALISGFIELELDHHRNEIELPNEDRQDHSMSPGEPA